MMDFATEYSELAAHGVAWGTRILIQSTLLIALGLAACSLLRHRSAALRSSILRATLITVLVCPFIGSVSNLRIVDVPIPQVTPIASEQRSPLVAPSLGSEPSVSSASIPRMDTHPATSQGESLQKRMGWPTLYTALCVCWITGAILLLSRLGLCFVRTRWLRRGAAAGAAHLTETCSDIAQRIGVTPPAVMVHSDVSSPLLTGILRPVILLPTDLKSTANPHVFAHELAHLRRRDCFWNALCSLVTALCFFQPLVWRLAAWMAQTSEEACDDIVLSYTGRRRTYARRLVEMAEALGCSPTARLGLGVVNLRSSLGRRVQRILSPETNRAIRTGRSALLSIVLIGILSVFCAGLLRIHPAVSAEATEAPGDRPESKELTAPEIMSLAKELTSPAWQRREAAAIALAQAAGAKDAAVPALAAALDDEQWQVRKAAAVALTTTGPDTRGAIPALIDTLGDAEWQVRRPAAKALAVMGPASKPAVPALSNAVGDEEWHVRRAAATALAAIGPASEPAVPALIMALADEEWQVRRAAATALAAIGPPSRPSIPQLLRRLDDEQWHVRESAALALGAIGPDAAGTIPTLIERLEDSEMQVRRAAASALERIAAGDKAAIPEIIDALLDTEWKRRQATAQSLERLL